MYALDRERTTVWTGSSNLGLCANILPSATISSIRDHRSLSAPSLPSIRPRAPLRQRNTLDLNENPLWQLMHSDTGPRRLMCEMLHVLSVHLGEVIHRGEEDLDLCIGSMLATVLLSSIVPSSSAFTCSCSAIARSRSRCAKTYLDDLLDLTPCLSKYGLYVLDA